MPEHNLVLIAQERIQTLKLLNVKQQKKIITHRSDIFFTRPYLHSTFILSHCHYNVHFDKAPCFLIGITPPIL